MSHRGPSRRELVLTGGAMLLAGAVAEARPQQSVLETQAQDLAVYGRAIRLTSSTDPTFGVQIDTLFPGLSRDPDFQAIAPLAILATNALGPHVKAISLSWTITRARDSFQKTVFLYHRASTSLLMTGDLNVLPAGETRLMTPFFTLGAKAYLAKPALDWNVILDRGALQEMFLAQEPQTATNIQIVPDAAVYSDWVLTGPDTAGLADHLRIVRNAEHDEAISVLKLIKANAPRQQLVQHLKRDRSIEGVHGESVPRSWTNAHWYFQSRTVQASVLLKRLYKQNTASFTDSLRNLRQRRKIAIRAISS